MSISVQTVFTPIQSTPVYDTLLEFLPSTVLTRPPNLPRRWASNRVNRLNRLTETAEIREN
jgi:hypothetical protein